MPTRARSGLSLIALPVPASHPVAAALSRLGSPGSARNRLAVLKRAAGLLSGRTRDVWSLPWADVRYAHLLALRAALQSLRLSASSINGTIVAVQAVCIECWRAGALSGDALQRLRDVPRVRASRLAAGRMLSLPELRRLADRARREGLHGARMLAAFALLYGCGLRLSEAAGLPVDALGRSAVRVIGKGNKEALVPFRAEVARLLRPWLDRRGDQPGPLLCALHKSGALRREAGLTSSGLYQAVAAFQRRAGLAHYTPHDLRRSFISHLLGRGVPLRDVQLLARHADPRTTAGYDRRPLRDLARRVDRLPF